MRNQPADTFFRSPKYLVLALVVPLMLGAFGAAGNDSHSVPRTRGASRTSGRSRPLGLLR